MNKHVAAILFGAILPALPVSARPAEAEGVLAPVTTHRPAFDELPSIRRVKPREVVELAVEEGRLLASWTGLVGAHEPVRLETPDLDAEWMAHAPTAAPPGRFALVRRDLQASADGRSWLVRLHGSAQRPETLQLIATGAARPAGSSHSNTVSVLLAQDAEWMSVRIWQAHGGRVEQETRLAGADLRTVARAYPLEYALLLRPVVEKLAALDLP